MVVTNDKTLYDRAVHFKGQGLAQHRQYWHDVIGFNYRMTNVCAAIGLAQLERADQLIEKKRQVAEQYRERLRGLPVTFHAEHPDVRHSYWMCSILVDEPDTRDRVRQVLSEEGVETRPLFYPVHTMPMYAAKFERHKVAEFLGWRGLNLPSWPELQPEQIHFISDAIARTLEPKHVHT
jgi:perosamine synthetase